MAACTAIQHTGAARLTHLLPQLHKDGLHCVGVVPVGQDGEGAGIHLQRDGPMSNARQLWQPGGLRHAAGMQPLA